MQLNALSNMFKSIKSRILKWILNEHDNLLKKKLLFEKQKLMSQLKSVGTGFKIGNDCFFRNPHCIEIGNKFSVMSRIRIEPIEDYEGQTFNPSIKIGNNVSFNSDIHIGCINKIEIGDNCLFASRIYITDHDHGDTSVEMLNIVPDLRPLKSKGPVIIKRNVWVGEGAAILAGVTIGENSIIATNAVVTKDVPANAVVGGIPAKIIKYIQ